MAELLRVKGALVLLECAHNCEHAAQDLFLQSLDWPRRQSALSWGLRAATSLSQLWHDRGRTKEAFELLAPIHDRFTEGFETADLRAAKALVDRLRTRSDDRAGRGTVAEEAAAAPDRPPVSFPVSELRRLGSSPRPAGTRMIFCRRGGRTPAENRACRRSRTSSPLCCRCLTSRQSRYCRSPI